MHQAYLKNLIIELKDIVWFDYDANSNSELNLLINEIESTNRSTIKICRNWKNHGHCQYGDNCHYRHGYNKKCKYDSVGCVAYKYGRCNYIHTASKQTNQTMINCNENINGKYKCIVNEM